MNEVWIPSDGTIAANSLRLIDGVWGFYPDAVVDEDGRIRTNPGETGTFKSYSLNALTDPSDIPANIINDATGFIAFRVRPADPTLATGDAVAVSWSTAAGDFSTLDTRNDTVVAAIGTPDGVGIENAYTIFPSNPIMDWIRAEGSATAIRSILVTASGGTEIVIVDTLS